ncbi:hypothetical protein SAMN05216369_1280 [Marinobacter antarcticus]|uniref:Uncharacterized protein n=1 Tax=Marinobacter antarcticus TaxID=564117 RepID=A0A1M6R319_9GAMM|nr:hypothetical protein [Marinobacter antarcticus]SHK26816.1 hypothetical protein SAMN05216369_1280 [Marinobacter antarcticus]
MEVAMAVLSVVGTLASFYGAWIAWNQAGISKSAANLAGRIKEQLINHRRTSELSELQVYIDSTKRTFLKYGSAKPSSLTGTNHNTDAEVALEFIHKLKSLRDYFSAPDGNAADDAFDEINIDLGRLKSARSSKDISDIGESILNKVVMFSPILKKELTEQKESSVE